MKKFDIQIVDVDRERTQPDSKYPGLYHVFFQLSTKPPKHWDNFFNQAWRNRSSSMSRTARITGDYVVVECPLEEIKEQLEYLKEDVATANDEYARAREVEVQEEQIKRKREDRAKKEKDDLLNQLDFD